MVIDHLYLVVSSLRKCSPALKEDRVTGCKRTSLAKHTGRLEDGGLVSKQLSSVCSHKKNFREKESREAHF